LLGILLRFSINESKSIAGKEEMKIGNIKENIDVELSKWVNKLKGIII
jgi:hypothetical protein